MRMFFGMATLLFVVAFAQSAEAVCVKKVWMEIDGVLQAIDVVRPPVAIADQYGVVVVKTPTGKPLEVEGFSPGKELCRSLLFKSASRKCPSGKARLHEERDAEFCKGLAEGHICVHVVCVGKSKATR